jgi:hypothetical protein
MGAADFSGYATKAGLKCRDGRTITPEAFKHMNGMKVPLVWQHGHNNPENVLGHVLLEARGDGVYAYGFFNDTKQGQNAKALVGHKDITAMSIWANDLVEKAKQVLHGVIREVSLVLSGANPGALIDYISIQHDGGDLETLPDEAIIYTGLALSHGETPTEEKVDDPDAVEHGNQALTAQDIYDNMSDAEKSFVHYMVGQALKAANAQDEVDDAAGHSGTTSDDGKTQDDPAGDAGDGNKNEGDLTHQEGNTIVTNVFEKDGATATDETHVLSHDAMRGIFADAMKRGSLKEAVEVYALSHGIENIDVLFPNAKNITGAPDFIKRRTEWVAGVLSGTSSTPFSRIKTYLADITMDEARAKGYIKGTLKKEEWISVSRRTTGPTTVYKKQKIDRDDILDITDFDVVMWLKGEIRLMLEEELARAILIGDGRDVSDDDKIKDPVGATDGIGIRSILNDHELYVTHVNVNLLDASSSYSELVDAAISSQQFFRGTGTPTLYTTLPILTSMLLLRDSFGRRLYRNKAELASEMGVADIQTVEPLQNATAYPGILGVIVNLQDYNVGADKGGEINLFDFFDIDFNQYKYLMETRVSGALTKWKSAIVLHAQASGDVLVDPVTAPTFVDSTGVVTIPAQANVTYKNYDSGATLSAGAQAALTEGQTLIVVAVPSSGHYFAQDQVWTFTKVGA